MYFEGNNIWNPWEDPTDTVTATAADDEGNYATDSDTAQVDIALKNQRSITVETYEFTVEDKTGEIDLFETLYENFCSPTRAISNQATF